MILATTIGGGCLPSVSLRGPPLPPSPAHRLAVAAAAFPGYQPNQYGVVSIEYVSPARKTTVGSKWVKSLDASGVFRLNAGVEPPLLPGAPPFPIIDPRLGIRVSNGDERGRVAGELGWFPQVIPVPEVIILGATGYGAFGASARTGIVETFAGAEVAGACILVAGPGGGGVVFTAHFQATGGIAVHAGAAALVIEGGFAARSFMGLGRQAPLGFLGASIVWTWDQASAVVK